MASTRYIMIASVTVSALAAEGTPVQGALDSAGAGITGGKGDITIPFSGSLTLLQDILAILSR